MAQHTKNQTLSINGIIKSTLEVLDHPLTGPIFSGPHQRPFICQTEANGLGPPLDSDCNAKTVVAYYYKSTRPAEASPLEVITAAFNAKPGSLSSGFKPYSPSGQVPSDIAQTMTSQGQSVPYIVRREIGVINRAVYDIQFLHQPGQPLPNPWSGPSAGWNGRLVYLFDGGCGAAYRQGLLTSIGAAQEPFLSQGYAVATATLNTFGNECNDRISAETLSVVKEHFTKELGEPVHTLGFGGSGGAIEQFLIAQNYPGLINGIIATGSRPDISSPVQFFTDYKLLDNAFDSVEQRWTDEQKTAVTGLASWRLCRRAWLPFLDPHACDDSVPREMIYDPIKNPNGTRCDIYANEVNVLGRDPHTGFARRSLDNVGVQYGLLAFNEGNIDAEQFVELNEHMGGYDDDGTLVSKRTIADPEAVRIAYASGFILTGGGGLNEVPIIDWRSYSDDVGDNHVRFLSFVTRARLVVARGTAGNQVILVDPREDLWSVLSPDPESLPLRRQRELIRTLDGWLDKVKADTASGSLAEKVARDRPTELADGCIATDGERIAEHATYGKSGRCNTLYPPYGDPRLAAGAPLTEDVLKCNLKPITSTDYSRPLSAEQLERLKAIFPLGVCDYSRPGVGQQGITKTWPRY